MGEVLRNPSFTTYILWTDEAIFNREGCFNSHDKHVWSDENPLALRPRAAQVRWSINLWAGICGEFIVGPYILPDRLDGPAYKYFLEHVLPDLMDDIPYEVRQNMYYQHDGAGPHFANIVRAYLGENLSGQVDRPRRARGPRCVAPTVTGYESAGFFLLALPEGNLIIAVTL